MDKKIGIIIVSVVIGIFIGMGISGGKSKKAVVASAITENLQIQKNIEGLLRDIKSNQQEMTTAVKNIKIGAGAQAKAAPTPQRPAVDPNKVYDIPVAKSYINGPKNAPVTIVEFVDFECPFCARFHPPITEVMQAYPKQVRYILKNFPLSFHPNARPAAKAAMAAGEQGKYYEMADKLLENGRNLNEDNYKKWAKELGLNVDKFMKDYQEKDAQWEKIINDDMTLGGKVNVRGTPSFYLNGKITNARNTEGWKSEIDAILKK